MNPIQVHKIHPVYMRPGDSINLHYSYQETADGPFISKNLKIDEITEPTMIDTVIVYKTETGDYGLKSGRVLILGEDDGTHKDAPFYEGVKNLIGGRVQK